jgi:hypothetical protein
MGWDLFISMNYFFQKGKILGEPGSPSDMQVTR